MDRLLALCLKRLQASSFQISFAVMPIISFGLVLIYDFGLGLDFDLVMSTYD